MYEKRALRGQFTDPTNEELVFKNIYDEFLKQWRKMRDWDILLPLNKDDRHHVTSMHIPLTSEQKEYDDQILSLAKIMVDSLNVSELRREAGIVDEKVKSIQLLEEFLAKNASEEDKKRVTVLITIQTMRSTAVAHRKGTKHVDALKKAGFHGVEGREVIRQLLSELGPVVA